MTRSSLLPALKTAAAAALVATSASCETGGLMDPTSAVMSGRVELSPDRENSGYGGDGVCAGGLSGTIDGDVIVPVDATCDLSSAVVRGNVKALEGARLYILDSHIHGNVEGDQAAVVHVVGGRVDGNIQIKKGTSPGEIGALVEGTVVSGGDIQIEEMRTGRVVVDGAEIRSGNLQVVKNHVRAALDLAFNYVRGNLQVVENLGEGLKFVQENEVEQDLQCRANTGPFTGGPNFAGDSHGQCF